MGLAFQLPHPTPSSSWDWTASPALKEALRGTRFPRAGPSGSRRAGRLAAAFPALFPRLLKESWCWNPASLSAARSTRTWRAEGHMEPGGPGGSSPRRHWRRGSRRQGAQATEPGPHLVGSPWVPGGKRPRQRPLSPAPRGGFTPRLLRLHGCACE